MLGLVHRATAVLAAFVHSNHGGGYGGIGPTMNRRCSPWIAGYSCSSTSTSTTTTATTRLFATRYLLHYDYVPDVLERRQPYREGHLNLAKDLVAEGRCLSGGPTGPPSMEVPTGALFVFADKDAAELFVQKDPYVANGIVTDHTIEEWSVVVE